jgi:4-amino-4-deoxy-L-arabinose transferase-like glycosyltransferase
MHPLMLRGIHAVLFPREIPMPAINVSSWELTVFADGIFFTLICLWLLYAIGKYLHSPAAGLWAAFFLAILPYGVEYSINGLSELPYAAFLLLSVYLVLRAKEKKERLLMLLAGVSVSILILTRKEGIILIPIMVLYILCRRSIVFKQKFKISAFFLIGTGLLLGSYYLIGGRFYWFSDYVRLLAKLTHQIFSQQAYTGEERSIFALYWIGKKYEFLTLPVGGFFKLSGFIPAILFVTYLFKQRRLNVNSGINLLILYASLHFAMICAQTILAKFLVTRYLFPVCMILFPIAGIMMVELLGRINLKSGKSINHHRIGLIVAQILAFLFILETIQNGFTSRHPETLTAAKWLEANTPVNTLIFTTDDRVGFYSRRPWKNVGLYNVLYDVNDNQKS